MEAVVDRFVEVYAWKKGSKHIKEAV